jgi:hypothetical protein
MMGNHSLATKVVLLIKLGRNEVTINGYIP